MRIVAMRSEWRIGEDDGGLDLPLGDVPIPVQELRGALARDEDEAVTAVEVDRPAGGGPRPDEHRLGGRGAQVLQQGAPDAAALAAGAHVGVADQDDVADGLDAHDAGELAARLVAPEPHAGGDLAVEL